MLGDTVFGGMMSYYGVVFAVFTLMLTLDRVGTQYILDKQVDRIGPQLFIQSTPTADASNYSIFTDLLRLRGLTIAFRNIDYPRYERIVFMCVGAVYTITVQVVFTMIISLLLDTSTTKDVTKWVLNLCLVELMVVSCLSLYAAIIFDRPRIWWDMIDPRRLSSS